MSAQLSSSFAIGFVLFAQLCVGQTTLTVAAAADLSSLEPDLTSSFGKSAPGPQIRLRFVNAASAVLTQQIQNGAPYDVFLSANAEYVDRLSSFGKLDPASVRAYGIGRVGLLWSDKKHHSFSDLAQNWVRFVALPDPKLAPYGAAATQALEHAGIWKAVQPKIVYGENVREALQLFESGNADAVLTSASLLEGKNPQLVPDDWHQPILQKAGIVAASPNRAAAEAFMKFLLSPAGQAVFAKFGFGAPTQIRQGQR